MINLIIIQNVSIFQYGTHIYWAITTGVNSEIVFSQSKKIFSNAYDLVALRHTISGSAISCEYLHNMGIIATLSI